MKSHKKKGRLFSRKYLTQTTIRFTNEVRLLVVPVNPSKVVEPCKAVPGILKCGRLLEVLLEVGVEVDPLQNQRLVSTVAVQSS